jgi:hypothetical protein
MRRIYLLLFMFSVFSTTVFAGEDAPAVLNGTDQRSTRVFLMGIDEQTVSTEDQKLRTKKQFESYDIELLEFTPVGYNENELKSLIKEAQTLFQRADYKALIDLIEPVTRPYGIYMSINNNLQETYGLLMEACSRSGQHELAGTIAANLMETKDKELLLKSRVCAAIAAANRKEFVTANGILLQIEDPAAALFARASIERADQRPQEAIQTAVEVIANHGDSMIWMPPTELLCAELYLENGRTNSAAVTARQTAKIYTGTNIGNEAGALYARLEEFIDKSE